MKYALRVVGRFAFCGWALCTGAVVAFFFVCSLIERRNGAEDFVYGVIFAFVYGLLGAAAGAVLALIALGLERVIKRRAAKPATAADEPAPDPAVWPPAPKLPL